MLSKRNKEKLTVHVQLDRAGYGRHQIVVRGLAGQGRVQVLALELLQDQDVPNFLGPHDLEAVVQELVLLPPGNSGLGATCVTAKKTV